MYIVSLTESLDSYGGRLFESPLSAVEFQRWLDVRHELTLDGIRPTVQQLMDRNSALLDSGRGRLMTLDPLPMPSNAFLTLGACSVSR